MSKVLASKKRTGSNLENPTRKKTAKPTNANKQKALALDEEPPEDLPNMTETEHEFDQQEKPQSETTNSVPNKLFTQKEDKEKIFEATTPHTDHIKKTFNVLKDFVVDINMIISKSGIRIINVNKDQTDLINVVLNKFDRYYCEPDSVMISIHAARFYKIIQTFSSKSVFSIYIKKCHFHEGIVSHICLLCVDGNNNKYREIEIKVLDSGIRACCKGVPPL